MNLVRTKNGLQVHNGGKADDREIGPEHELAAALNNMADALRENARIKESLLWQLPPSRRAAILGISPRSERRMRQMHETEQSLSRTRR